MDYTNNPGIFQYYTVVNSNSTTETTEEAVKSQLVYFTIDNTCDVTDSATDSLEVSEDNHENDFHSSESSVNPNVKIITLDDGRIFVTTGSEEEKFESIEPHLISTSSKEVEENEVEEEGLSGNADENESLDDGKYEIVQILDDTPHEMFEMVYCDTPPEQANVKKGKSYVCLYEGCGKMYNMAHQLDVHMRNHLCFKPYACTEEGCDKTFSTNYSLKAHIRTHTGEKPYSCSICQKAFKTSGDLQKHVRIHTGEKPFMCPVEYCGKSFTTSNIRKVHVRSHTGERPYTCNYPNCGKAFSSSTNYKNHIRIHSGEKPYVCQIKDCGKRFTEYSSLYKHNMVHQTYRPHSCRFCGQKFKQQTAMSLHKRVKHNIIIASDGTEIVVDIN